MFPLRALDVLALVLYGNWGEKLLARELAAVDYPAGIRRIDIGNANDPESVEALKEAPPGCAPCLGQGFFAMPSLRYRRRTH